ncbi:MAG: N-acetylmuramoyl-L-alanine amidase [Magnetococcales bacterium]|nr:N-acetylmuramoyl-L-alanine amidase [Magnetococcales bacterium]
MESRERQIGRLIIHCSATPNGRHHTAAEIDLWHRQRGFAGIGYHFVIRTDGVVEAGRPVARSGAHARGFNRDSIGICLIGTDRFTEAQWQKLDGLIQKLKADYPGAVVLGHRDLPRVAKICPGFDVDIWATNPRQMPKSHILPE